MIFIVYFMFESKFFLSVYFLIFSNSYHGKMKFCCRMLWDKYLDIKFIIYILQIIRKVFI